MAFRNQAKKNQPTIHNPENLDRTLEDSKRDTWISIERKKSTRSPDGSVGVREKVKGKKGGREGCGRNA